MSTPPHPPGPADMDLGNPLLARAPFLIRTTRARAPDGTEVLVFTVRQGNTTQTVFMDRAEAQAVHGDLGETIAKMTVLIVPGNGGPR